MAPTQNAVVIVVAGVILSTVGLVQSFGELGPYFSGGAAPELLFGSIVAGTYEPGDSKWSRDLFLTDCLDVSSTIYAKAQPARRRHNFLERCRDVARGIAVAAPTYSVAWLVVALASADLGDAALMRSALIMSTRAAPNVLWLSERRTALADRHMSELGDAERAAYLQDLGALLQSRGGVDVLAARYVRQPQLRDTLTSVAERVPSGWQQAFLTRVRQLAAGTSP